MTSSPRPIGSTTFIDGVTRTVYEDGEDDGGRQFVIDDETGDSAYGVWLDIADPKIVRQSVGMAPRSDDVPGR